MFHETLMCYKMTNFFFLSQIYRPDFPSLKSKPFLFLKQKLCKAVMKQLFFT